MNKENQYVDQRLQAWADWYTRGLSLGLGYPPKNLLVRLKETGGLRVKSTGQAPLLSHPKAEEIEQLVCQLAQQYRFLANTLREYYCGEGMMSQKAKRLDMSYRQFKHCVDKAKMWLAGRLAQVKYG